MSERFFVDVRSPEEFAGGHLVGAVNIPLPELVVRAAEIPQGTAITTVCQRGGRSARAASLLRSMGYDAESLAGGMEGQNRRV